MNIHPNRLEISDTNLYSPLPMLMRQMKIATLNARGGGNKMNEIISLINKSGIDVICFQEMHVVNDYVRRRIESVCDGKLYVSNGTTQSRGVATFVKNKVEISQIGISKKDNIGRKLIVQIETQGKTWHIFNLYAPNDAGQRHTFFQEIRSDTQKYTGTILYAGDFNCVLDRYMDRTESESKGATRIDKSRDTLRKTVERANMIDCYRRVKPLGIMYTFSGSNGYRARLDRLYVDKEMADLLVSVDVQAITYSDHDLVVAVFGKIDANHLKWGQVDGC